MLILSKKRLYYTLPYILFCTFYKSCWLTCSVWLFSTDLSNCACVTVMDVNKLYYYI
jgi:hypothetical protein